MRHMRCARLRIRRRMPRASLRGNASDSPVFGTSADTKMRDPNPNNATSCCSSIAAQPIDAIPISNPKTSAIKTPDLII